MVMVVAVKAHHFPAGDDPHRTPGVPSPDDPVGEPAEQCVRCVRKCVS